MPIISNPLNERRFADSDYSDSHEEIKNKKQISLSQHSLPPFKNKTKIKRCLSSPSFISSYDNINNNGNDKSCKKQHKMKQLPDLMELYKNIPSCRLKIENLSRQTRLPIICSNGSYILCHHKSNCFRNAIMFGFFRTFAASFVLKTCLLLFENVLFGKIRKKKEFVHQLSNILSNRDSLFFAQFMGLMSFTYKAILCLLRRYFKKDEIKYHSIAGFLSGFWIILDSNHRRQQAYAMNGIIRASYDAIKLCVFYDKLPRIPGFNLVCFSLTQLILINAAFWKPNSVHPTLYKFLLKMSNMNKEKIQVLRDGILNERFVKCCPSLHKEKSCLIYNLKDFLISFKRASLLFIAVHFLPLLLFEPKKVFLNPNKYFQQSSINTIISCLFIASYNLIVKGNICLFRNIFQKDYWWSGIFCILCASLTLMIENVKRRPELTLHCLTRSSEILMRLFTQNKWPKLYQFVRSKYLRVISFQICISLWLTIRQIPKGIEKSNNLNMTIVRMIFGSNN